MSGEPLSEMDRKVLALVRQGGDRASWHWLGTRAPSLGFPVPDIRTLLKDLARRGFLNQAQVGGGMDRWTLTPAGVAALEGEADRPVPPGPLSARELQALAAELSQPPREATLALVKYIDDGPRLAAALRQLVAWDGGHARRASLASLFLRPGDQAAFARGMMEDPRPEVRKALFEAWAPPRNEVPGQASAPPDPEALDALLRTALLDPSRDVRAAATAYAFAAGRGPGIVGELLANVEAPERDLRSWTLLALGGAGDDLSRRVLEQVALEPDAEAAAAAIRALAARADGREAWLRALEGADGEPRRAALFGLAEVARGLTPEQLARIARDAREDTQRALARYRARAATLA
jgi:hypothetical protein